MRVTWWWLVLAGVVNLVSILAKGAVWKASLDAVRVAGRIPWRAVVSAMFVGFLLNTVLAARVGEVARVAVLKRRLRLQGLDIRFATVAGTVIAEQVVLGLALVIAHPRQPRWRSRQASCRAWFSQVLAISLALTAFGIHAGLAAAALVFVTTTLASLFPLVPASIGAFQGAVSVALVSAYGVAPAVALAFSVALQLVEMAFGIGLGLACLAAEGLSLTNARALISTERSVDAG